MPQVNIYPPGTKFPFTYMATSGTAPADPPPDPNIPYVWTMLDAVLSTGGLATGPYMHGFPVVVGTVLFPKPGNAGHVYYMGAALMRVAYRSANGVVLPLPGTGQQAGAALAAPPAPAPRDPDQCACGHKPMTRYSSFNPTTGVRDPWKTCAICGVTEDG